MSFYPIQLNAKTFIAQAIEFGETVGVLSPVRIDDLQKELADIMTKSLLRLGIDSQLHQTLDDRTTVVERTLDIGLEEAAQSKLETAVNLLARCSLQDILNHGFDCLCSAQDLTKKVRDSFVLGGVNWYPELRSASVARSHNKTSLKDEEIQTVCEEQKNMNQTGSSRANLILFSSREELAYYFRDMSALQNYLAHLDLIKRSRELLNVLGTATVEQEVVTVLSSGFWVDYLQYAAAQSNLDIWLLIDTILVNIMMRSSNVVEFIPEKESLAFLKKIRSISSEHYFSDMDAFFENSPLKIHEKRMKTVFMYAAQMLHEYAQGSSLEDDGVTATGAFLHQIIPSRFLVLSETEPDIDSICKKLVCCDADEAYTLLENLPAQTLFQVIKQYSSNWQNVDVLAEFIVLIRQHLIHHWSANVIAELLMLIDRDVRTKDVYSYKGFYNRAYRQLLRKMKEGNTARKYDEQYLDVHAIEHVFKSDFAREIYLQIPFVKSIGGKRKDVRFLMGITEIK